jgi:hypothetical protein
MKTQMFKDIHGREWPIVPASELNLDDDPGGRDYLMAFWARYNWPGRVKLRELFPDAKPRDGSFQAAVDLACYASNKATAIACRLRGDVNAALIYEGICDRLYAELPDWAKGW